MMDSDGSSVVGNSKSKVAVRVFDSHGIEDRFA
jgi:hypothetical protein